MFGAGKSTSVLSACLNGNGDFVFVPCRDLPARSGGAISTKRLLSEVCRILDFDDRFRDPFAFELAGEVLEALLCSADNKMLLVFDALDEHRYFGSQEGFTELSNHVKKFRCPVVFTVRQEVVHGLLGNYETPLKQVSDAGSRPRPGRKLELLPWTDRHILRRIESRLAKLPAGAPKTRLQEFARLVGSGESDPLYGDLPRNPLMLTFLIDDVMEQGLRKLVRAELLFDYVQRKIMRDRDCAPAREHPGADSAPDLLVARMMRAMMGIAWQMASKDESGLAVPGEGLPVSSALAIAQHEFGEAVSAGGLALNSLLVIRRPGRYEEPRFSFVIQLFGEFFLALAMTGRPEARSADAAVELIRAEIARASDRNPHSDLSQFVKSLAGGP